MGYVPEPWPSVGDYGEQIMGPHGSDAPFRPNLDRHGMPRDYATYVWLLYGKVVEDDSPARRAFLNGSVVSGGWAHPRLGSQVICR